MNHSLSKIHLGKSNHSNIRFSGKYGSSSEDSSKKTKTKEEDSCPICSETASIVYSLFFYILNFMTELLAPTGFFSSEIEPPTYLLAIFAWFMGIFAICALIGIPKVGSIVTSSNFIVKSIKFIVKSINFIAISSLVCCNILSFKDIKSPLSYPCVYISLLGIIFMMISTAILKIIIPYYQESLDENKKDPV
jgi:hypothetical protein